ncbi:universal stress protein [Flaviaesturariibacter flavus]|uniref:Universal stress protein n=1 Tax=Flaviaesturariibacter flavus TaxID=2502780 RepID=A0A4R1BNH9_9BACT|nr:universal stress protein [Flaviaesturariibacter flavus]TCJ19089.1 universal stress protein [Flaviaesturariibacter flavus]
MAMKKVLLLFDGLNFYENMISFVQRMHVLSPVLATGVFAPVVSLANLWSYAGTGEGGMPVPALLESEEETELSANIRRFEQMCQASRVPHRVHQTSYDLALYAVHEESRFADLLILSGDAFYNEMLYASPAQYLRDALHDTECPVLVLPERPTFPADILIAYDGSRESVYALKQFAYLFPEWTRLETTVVHSARNADRDFPQSKLIGELVGAHYKKAEFRALSRTDGPDFKAWVEGHRDALLVAGAFSRGWISELFHGSFCADLVRQHRIPIFIAHH